MSNALTLVLTFDTEDFLTPAADDAALALASVLREHGIRATFCVVGEKARTLRRRGRQDVIDVLGFHDIGFHSDRHSVHPTLAEYVADCTWQAGVDAIVEREQQGVLDVAEIFGRYPSTFAPAGTSWAPQIAAACHRLDVPTHLHSYSRTQIPGGRNPHWYQDVLCFGRDLAVGTFDDPLFDGDGFEDLRTCLGRRVSDAADSSTGFVHVYVGHPTRLVTEDWWDVINFAEGRNPSANELRSAPLRTPGDVAAGIARFAEFIGILRRIPGVSFATLADVATVQPERRRTMPPSTRQGLVAEATGVSDGIAFSSEISAAELLEWLARSEASGPDEPFTVGKSIAGPIEVPPLTGETRVQRPVLRDLARCLVAHVDAHGHLPSVVRSDRLMVSVGSLYEALRRIWARDSPASEVNLLAVEPLPQVGRQMAEDLLDYLPRWLHHPQLDGSGLAALAALQSWTIRSSAGDWLVGRRQAQ